MTTNNIRILFEFKPRMALAHVNIKCAYIRIKLVFLDGKVIAQSCLKRSDIYAITCTSGATLRWRGDSRCGHTKKGSHQSTTMALASIYSVEGQFINETESRRAEPILGEASRRGPCLLPSSKHSQCYKFGEQVLLQGPYPAPSH